MISNNTPIFAMHYTYGDKLPANIFNLGPKEFAEAKERYGKFADRCLKARRIIEEVAYDKAVKLLGSNNVTNRHPLYFIVNPPSIMNSFPAYKGGKAYIIDEMLLHGSTFCTVDSWSFYSPWDCIRSWGEFRDMVKDKLKLHVFSSIIPGTDDNEAVEGHFWGSYEISGNLIGQSST